MNWLKSDKIKCKYPNLCKSFSHSFHVECDNQHSFHECPDSLFVWSKQHNTFGISVKDGGTAFVVINFCPFCGNKIN